MNPKYWWPLGFFSVGVIGVFMEFMNTDTFDPESLPPPAAGTTIVTTRTQNTCEGIVYSISEDGIKYVHESGGSTLLAAKINNKIGFYQLGRLGEVEKLDEAEIDTKTSKLLEYTLTNCDARYNPSGVFFALM
jgi:hypothetical protein